MYYYTFSTVFRLFKNEFKYNVQWMHIHGTGLVGITIDQDYKALLGKYFQTAFQVIRNRFWINKLGFSAYLSTEVDPDQRGWLFHAKRTVRFCHVHFQRGVEKIAGENRAPDSLFSRMMQLLQCSSEDDYLELCHALKRKLSINHFLSILNRF